MTKFDRGIYHAMLQDFFQVK